eukprot:CAMPEP_0173381868 /NCGR_PEP_ID=MMETSP1356-20130122/4306_1 /TAXON_ID=77927 ORGANISM="Hemiselmis virescens, Strain PCC157" /NCGR_SAMPLE_ID=MMETSP1356 /ASSEMBLY_ACC=CAM_ASM_000847 /LENGTH=129 /DNA_ID=CAMNT_0014335915 /DNA_START=434 /DNA_END=823 /DNA_ORIENTATION=+
MPGMCRPLCMPWTAAWTSAWRSRVHRDMPWWQGCLGRLMHPVSEQQPAELWDRLHLGAGASPDSLSLCLSGQQALGTSASQERDRSCQQCLWTATSQDGCLSCELPLKHDPHHQPAPPALSSLLFDHTT